MLQSLVTGPLKGLLFDLDGTLIDSAPDIAAALDGTLLELNLLAVGPEKTRQWIGNGAKMLVAQALADARCCELAEISKSEINKTYSLFLKHYELAGSKYSLLFEGVIPALEFWHQQGLKMALVTNKPQQFVPALLNHFQLDSFFQCVVGGDTLAERKPSAIPLLYACEQLKLDPKNCVMIGDSVVDVAAARAAKISVACVNYGYSHGNSLKESKPDFLVGSLQDLMN